MSCSDSSVTEAQVSTVTNPLNLVIRNEFCLLVIYLKGLVAVEAFCI